jgi:hypothetical protein
MARPKLRPPLGHGTVTDISNQSAEACHWERRLNACKRKPIVHLLHILACAVIGGLATADQANASDIRPHIKSITFSGRTIDRAHSLRLQNWTVSFGRSPPFAGFNKQGTTLRNLRCSNSKFPPVKCHIFMSMTLIQSFANFCEISPDDRQALRLRPMRINCPNEIKYYR